MRHHLEHGCCIYGPFFKEDQKAVEQGGRALLSQASNKDHPRTEEVPILRATEYPGSTVSHRRRRGDMIRTYQVIYADLSPQPDDFLTPATYSSTRGHKWKLRKEQARLRVRRDCFSVRVLNDWNALPTDVVQAESLNQFKWRLDAHWAGIRFHIPD